MALDSRIMKLVDDRNMASTSHDAQHLTASVIDDLAELGLAKATKIELRRIVVRAINRERLDD
jgi:hypothetical protein